MDPLLLKYYERELQFIREMGLEYAHEFPEIAHRLGISGPETKDPYVERLYEGFAFLAARVHLRIDAEYPRFTQNLLNIVYPQYLTPIPAMAVAQFQPSENASLEEGVKIPRDTALRSALKKGQQTPCEFRTSQDVTLWPIKIDVAEYFSNLGSLANLPMKSKSKPKAGLRLVLNTTSDVTFNELMLDKITLHLCGQSGQAMRIYEQLFGNCCGVVARSTEKPSSWTEVISPNNILPVGFEAEEALLPEDRRNFSGYRLIREYFSFRERFMFAQIEQLERAVEQCHSSGMEIIFLFEKDDPELENRVTVEDFALNCSPIINLFPKRSDRIHISNLNNEYHVVADRTRPMDFEVFQVEGVKGIGTIAEEQQTFLPFYSCNDLTDFPEQQAFFSLRQERRRLSSKQKRQGPRSSYTGSETFVSLVDVNEAPFSSELKQLDVSTLCTNRDLPLQMALGSGGSDFSLDVNAPLSSIRCIGRMTSPKPSLAHEAGESAWRLINQLSLNYLSLIDNEEHRGAAAMRELLSLYADKKDASLMKQVEGLRSVQAEQVTRRIPIPGPIAFGRGLKITVTFDESAFVGTGIFLLGSVLEKFFARFVSINSFTETVVYSTDRGEVKKWPVRIGQRKIV